MKVLLDTHAFLWWVTDDRRLSTRAREIIGNGENELYFSAASGWEIAIKASLGRMQLSERPAKLIPEQLSANAIESLAITMTHALHVHSLPPHHRDPFDRMLVAQAQVEGLPILTADPQLASYDVTIIP